VHLSNVFAREAFRSHSYVSPSARGVIVGLGAEGYVLALSWLASQADETVSADRDRISGPQD
jgi:3-dehydroquinate dehydratase-2